MKSITTLYVLFHFQRDIVYFGKCHPNFQFLKMCTELKNVNINDKTLINDEIRPNDLLNVGK